MVIVKGIFVPILIIAYIITVNGTVLFSCTIYDFYQKYNIIMMVVKGIFLPICLYNYSQLCFAVMCAICDFYQRYNIIMVVVTYLFMLMLIKYTFQRPGGYRQFFKILQFVLPILDRFLTVF